MREMIAVRAPALPGRFLDARLGRRGIIRSLASHAGGPAPGRAAARPAPATSCGSVLWMLASDGGAPAPRRPAAQFSGCSPRTAGPQPRDVLRLTLRP